MKLGHFLLWLPGFAVGLAACSGSDGKDGKTCTISKDDAGATAVVCPDGTSAVLVGGVSIPAADGGATSCTISQFADGTKLIVCPDGTTIPVSLPNPDAAGTMCNVVNNGNGTSTMTCPGGDGGLLTVTVKNALVNFATLSAESIAALDLKVDIKGITIPATGTPVVALRATDRASGNAVAGLPPAAMRFALVKLIPAVVGKGGNDTWVSYMAANPTSVASTETAAATATATNGALADNGDGNYVYTFAKNILDAANAGTTYDANATHRLVIRLSQSASGAQTFTPVNVVKDFVPATGKDVTGLSDKVDSTTCLDCHSSFRAKAGGTGVFHGGSLYDIRMCVACHNDQQRYTPIPGTGTTPMVDLDAPGTLDEHGAWAGSAVLVNGEAYLNFGVFIHKIHMGEELTLNGGAYRGMATPYEVTYPQDIRNCVKCHRSVAQADVYKTKPSRRACGACHDDKSFAAAPPVGRTAHVGGAMADDMICASCHPATGKKTAIMESHVPVAAPSPQATWLGGTNANTHAAYMPAAGVLPTGAAKITYDVKSVIRDANKNPSIVFRLVKDEVPVVFNTYVVSAVTELMDGFVGSPSVYFAFAIPQDGIRAPADFNATTSGYIKSIWNGSATGTMTFDATTGYYTITLTGTTIPDSATMLTGGVGYTYSLSSAPPLTQINLPAYPYGDGTVIKGCIAGKLCGGLIVSSADVALIATDAVTGKVFTPRRAIVSTAKCIACHEQLGSNPSFHAGQRNDASTCAFCHRPNQTSGGWSADSSTFIHGIHGASIRTVDFNWHAACPIGTTFAAGTCTKDNADPYYAKVTYPGILKNCQQCHLPGTHDFSATASAAALPNLLMSTVGANPNSTALLAADISTSPYVTPGTDYGLGFTTLNITTGTLNGIACATTAPCVCSLATPCEAAPTTLVKSPITAACATCHDSPNGIKHMQSMGGTFYGARLAAKAQSEMCLMCHGKGTVAAIADVHK